MADDVGGTLQRHLIWTLGFKKPSETSDITQLYIVANAPLSESIRRKKDSLYQQGIRFFPPVKWENVDETIKFSFETRGTFQPVGQDELCIVRKSLEKNDGVYIGSVFLMKTEASQPSENKSLHVTIRILTNGGQAPTPYNYELLLRTQQPNSATPDVNLTPTSNQPTSRLPLKGGVGSLDDSGIFSPANTPSSSHSVPYTHSELKDLNYTPPSSGEEFDGYVGGVGSLDGSGICSPANTPSSSHPGYTHAELKVLKYTPPSSGEEFDGYAAPKPKNDEEVLTKNDEK